MGRMIERVWCNGQCGDDDEHTLEGICRVTIKTDGLCMILMVNWHDFALGSWGMAISGAFMAHRAE